jgi:hypothetical protein
VDGAGVHPSVGQRILRWLGLVRRRVWSGKGVAVALIVLAAASSLVLVVLVLDPDTFGKDYNADPLIALVPVGSTLALSIMTYLMLRASENQVQTLKEQVEGERAALQFQQAEAERSAEQARTLLREERENRKFQEREAERSAAATKALFEESVKARRDDHAPSVTVRIGRGDVWCQQQQGDGTWRSIDMPDLFPDQLERWKMTVHISFVVRNDGPGVAVLDLSPSFIWGELQVPDDWGEHEQRVRQGVLTAGSEAVVTWRQVGPGRFWRDQAERGWRPPPVKENPWVLDFTFVTWPPGQQVMSEPSPLPYGTGCMCDQVRKRLPCS